MDSVEQRRQIKETRRRDVLQEYADISERVARAFEPFQPRTVPDGEPSNIYSFQIRCHSPPMHTFLAHQRVDPDSIRDV